ncbi:MAG TPA: CHC2 zinc finger domain-containing protein [Candidatus Azoamicus sp.]
MKKTKNGYLALCPFHIDKTPSFFKFLYKKYYCFHVIKKVI